MINTSIELQDYVIDPINDIDTLEKQYNNYNTLTIDLQRKVDDIAISKYGYDNMTLYNIIKSRLLDNKIDINVDNMIGTNISEEFNIDSMSYDNSLYDKIEKAKRLQSNTCAIIYPYTTKYPYTIEDLNQIYTRYNNLSRDLQQLSDQESISLFGNDVRVMYNKYYNELENMKDNIDNIIDGLNEESIIDNYIDKLHMVDIISSNNTSNIDILEVKLHKLPILEEIISQKTTASISVPEFVPYLLPLEIEDLSYNDGLSNNEIEFLEKYKKDIIEGMVNFNDKEYLSILKNIYEDTSISIDKRDKTLIHYGWNPNIPLTKRSFRYANKRLSKYIDTYYNPIIVDLEAFGSINHIKDTSILDEDTKYTDYFNNNSIFLIRANDKFYISYDNSFKILYNYNNHTIYQSSIDAMDDNTIITVYMLYVDNEIKDILQSLYIPTAISNKYYTFFNILNYNDNDKVMAAKILTILANLINKHYAISNINKQAIIANNAKIYLLYMGQVSSYNIRERNTTDYLCRVIKDKPFIGKKLSICEDINSVYNKLSNNRSIEYCKLIEANISNTIANNIIKNIKDLVSPIYVLEAKSAPLRINQSGIIIDLPNRIEEEYQAIHKTIDENYNQSNYDAMKDSLAHLWYLNLLCERKITKFKDKENKKDQLRIKTNQRSRILNDFKKYYKKIMEEEPDFDFTKYFENSKWNDNSIFIDMETLKYTGEAIKNIAKRLFGYIKK